MEGSVVDLANVQGKVILFIIDPQNDFISGNLPVEGAEDDMKRIIKMITLNGSLIDEIHISLDSHTPEHIAHAKFWEKNDSSEDVVKPHTMLALVDVSNNELEKNQDNFHENNYIIKDIDPKTKKIIGNTYLPKNKELLSYVKNYMFKLTYKGDSNDKPSLYIWPDHCIITEQHLKDGNETNESETPTDGWKVHNQLWEAVIKWRHENNSENKKLFIHEKGTNNLTEMYSIFSAEVPYEELIEHVPIELKYSDPLSLPDPWNPYTESDLKHIAPYNLSTVFNEKLFDYVTYSKGSDGSKGPQNVVIFCGEAKSHCVRTSVEDYMKHIAEGQKNKVCLLTNAMSNVGGFEDYGKHFETFFQGSKFETDQFNSELVSKLKDGNKIEPVVKSESEQGLEQQLFKGGKRRTKKRKNTKKKRTNKKKRSNRRKNKK